MKKNILTTILFVACCFTIPLHAFKVLFIVGSFPTLSEPFILNQITGLIDRGHDVYIYASAQETDGIQQSEVAKYRLIERTYYRTLPQNFSVDIVMCQFGPLYGMYKQLKGRHNLQTKKVVTCFRGSDMSIVEPSCASICNEVATKCDLLLPVCNYFKNMLVKAGCNPKRVITVHSAINCSKFKFRIRSFPENKPIHIVTTARLAEKKGLEYAIEAVALVKEKYPNITYTIIGGGTLEQALRDLISSLNLEDTVNLVGRKNHDDVIRILDTAHLFMLPSVTSSSGGIEGIANSLKEAMAMGLPSIGTYHSGTPELITDGVSGFLVPEKDVAALANRMIYIIEHPEIWSALGTAGRKKVEQEFEIEKENDRLAEILKSLLKSGDKKI